MARTQRPPDTGRRLVANVIDSKARNQPSQAWASLPADDKDLTRGFKDISYREFADAIDRAAWWLSTNVPFDGSAFQCLAYSGPKDLRYPILAVAALKCSKKLFVPSPTATPEALKHLLNATRCNVYLHDAGLRGTIQSSVGQDSDIQLKAIPELEAWLFSGEAPPFPYTKSWEEGWADPWLVFHTSGTTGLPKPVTYTNWMMTSFDAAELMPDSDQETMNDLFRDSRCYTILPLLTFVGMTAALQWTTFLDMVLVMGPRIDGSLSEILQILDYGRVSGAVIPPSLIDGLCHQPKGVASLRKLDYLYFVGAPLSENTAKQLVGHTKVIPAMGSTEAGGYFLSVRNDDDWQYYHFRPSMGVHFEQRTPELYELVFRKQPELARWQQLFHIYPDLDEYQTKDLWTRHPSKPNLWRYAARTDDLIKLSRGDGLWTSGMEADIQDDPNIRSALVGGHGKPNPFAILELADSKSVASLGDRESWMETIWPSIAKANQRCDEYVRLAQDYVIFAEPEKSLPRTAKDTVARQASLALYTPEIERLYQH